MSGGGRVLATGSIVDAALRVGRAKGFGNVTMRALAEELGVSAMAAYHHVPNKQALIALVVDVVLAEVEIPSAEFGPWDERLRELQRRSQAALAAHPGIEALVYGSPPTAQGRRLMDAYLAILLDAGFSRTVALNAFSVMHAHGLGRFAIERGATPVIKADAVDPWAQLRTSRSRDFGVDLILAGLRALLASGQSDHSFTS